MRLRLCILVLFSLQHLPRRIEVSVANDVDSLVPTVTERQGGLVDCSPSVKWGMAYSFQKPPADQNATQR